MTPTEKAYKEYASLPEKSRGFVDRAMMLILFDPKLADFRRSFFSNVFRKNGLEAKKKLGGKLTVAEKKELKLLKDYFAGLRKAGPCSKEKK